MILTSNGTFNSSRIGIVAYHTLERPISASRWSSWIQTPQSGITTFPAGWRFPYLCNGHLLWPQQCFWWCLACFMSAVAASLETWAHLSVPGPVLTCFWQETLPSQKNFFARLTFSAAWMDWTSLSALPDVPVLQNNWGAGLCIGDRRPRHCRQYRLIMNGSFHWRVWAQQTYSWCPYGDLSCSKHDGLDEHPKWWWL